MRGKFTRGIPQESKFQISSHSETELIRRASSSNRDNNGKKRVKCNVLYYSEECLNCRIECLNCRIECFNRRIECLNCRIDELNVRIDKLNV